MHPFLQTLQKHREAWILFGSGLLAGLLFFLVWWAMQPSAQTPGQATTPATTAAGNKPGQGADGVLGDITGDLQPGPARDVVGPDVSLEEIDSISNSPAPEGGVLPDGDAPPMTDEEAIAGGLLGSDAPPPPLQTYYVEVMRGPDASELLELEASSPEHALRILRDFRGNPRVVRGPSAQPLP
ncbi:MAG: hypothetical protein A3E01_04345 [Gammaproteobacteria bacterium RIFCSPHIGHO2_12_FULL_63_22]|nr:MAG: hypothetical protein A3E01_04345 [Gammaproteobacteria bacterium RIFCSPHIGHO2_12_FULL_63_22]